MATACSPLIFRCPPPPLTSISTSPLWCWLSIAQLFHLRQCSPFSLNYIWRWWRCYPILCYNSITSAVGDSSTFPFASAFPFPDTSCSRWTYRRRCLHSREKNAKPMTKWTRRTCSKECAHAQGPQVLWSLKYKGYSILWAVLILMIGFYSPLNSCSVPICSGKLSILTLKFFVQNSAIFNPRLGLPQFFWNEKFWR
jgi:hypothetical protein